MGRKGVYCALASAIFLMCFALTAVVFGEKMICSECDAKSYGKYYVDVLGSPAMCKECAEEYYLGFPGDWESDMVRTLPNTRRNTLWGIEAAALIAAVIVINIAVKKKGEQIMAKEVTETDYYSDETTVTIGVGEYESKHPSRGKKYPEVPKPSTPAEKPRSEGSRLKGTAGSDKIHTSDSDTSKADSPFSMGGDL